MNNKKMTIFDKGEDIKDKGSIKGTDIILKELESGKVLFRGHNKVIVSGSEFNAIKDFDFDNYVGNSDFDFLSTIPSYDMAFASANRAFTPTGSNRMPLALGDFSKSGFDSLKFFTGTTDDSTAKIFSTMSPSNLNAHKLYRYFMRRVCLYCVGIDGCGIEASRVFKVHNTKWIAPYGYADYNDGTGGNNTYNHIDNCLIPFKYKTYDADLSTAYRKQYFGRSLYNNTIAYYFKTFDELPKIIRRYADDSTDLSNVDDVWKDKRASEAEVVVQLKMSISATDCREYFGKSTGVNDSKINTISLCSAIPYLNSAGLLEYADIRPFTRFNFPNEALIDTSKGIDITYYLYY